MDVLRRLAVVALVLLTVSCASAPRTRDVARSIDATISTPPFQHAIWGILVEEEDGRRVYARNAETLMIPASNRKLFAAFTVANCLGFDSQLETTIWRDGDDLVVRGDGDPSLGAERYSRERDFDRVAALLRERGIVEVRDVIADVSSFDRVIVPGGWKVGNLASAYSAPVDALAWSENAVRGAAVREPGLHAAESLRDALLFAGIAVNGAVRLHTEPRQWQERLVSIPSPFTSQLLRTVLKNSQNLYTEMLFKRASGGSYDASFAIEQQTASSDARVPRGQFRFADGSGLAPDNLVSPRASVAMLRWMNEPHRRAMWWQLLAQPGDEGTLRRRLVPLSARLRGKTGTINGVNALSGIVSMPGGGFRYFSVVVNHHLGDSDVAQQLIDRVVETIAQE